MDRPKTVDISSLMISLLDSENDGLRAYYQSWVTVMTRDCPITVCYRFVTIGAVVFYYKHLVPLKMDGLKIDPTELSYSNENLSFK